MTSEFLDDEMARPGLEQNLHWQATKLAMPELELIKIDYTLSQSSLNFL